MTSMSLSQSYDNRGDTSTTIDFEDLVDRQLEDEMPEAVIWIAIEQRHLNRISRAWTIFCICVQFLAFLCIIGAYFFISLMDFEGVSSILTPLLYITHRRTIYFYFSVYFGGKENCLMTVVDSSSSLNVRQCICDALMSSEIVALNSCLVFILIGVLVAICFGIYWHY